MIKTARKEHDCMAWEWLDNSEIEQGQLTFTELRSIVKAIQNDGKILKGQKYFYHYGKNFDGEYETFRAIPELHEICKRLEIYQYQ